VEGFAVSIHEQITTRILEQLEAGTAPWLKPWGVPMPYNATTQRRYSGINVLLLWDTEYQRPAWLTLQQARALSAHVRRGEHATPVVYVSKFTKTDGVDERSITFLKRYYVFNVDQVDGLPAQLYAVAPSVVAPQVGAFLAGTNADVRHGGTQAFYNRHEDYVQLPHPEHFVSPATYYATLLHEIVHWTGHPTRLKREVGAKFGDQAYAFEELVAEIGSAYLSADLGLAPELHHVEYLGHWVKLLRDHRQAIVSAAARASEAAGYILSLARAAPEGTDVAA
jgi:antirestriction protein ArdC